MNIQRRKIGHDTAVHFGIAYCETEATLHIVSEKASQ
jgi:hypothetical protein